MNDILNFVYEDTDTYQNEVSEIFSYCEETEFLSNRYSFEEFMEDCGLPLTWEHMVKEQKWKAINHIMSTLDVSCRATRIKSCRSIAYLVQGKFHETINAEHVVQNNQDIIFMLYEQNVFQIFVQQLMIEANQISDDSSLEQPPPPPPTDGSGRQAYANSAELRVILSVLCSITETMIHTKNSPDQRIQDLRQQFIMELQSPYGDELLPVTLFKLLNTFCSGFAPHYPVRKLTILLWKVLLLSLGGADTLRELKSHYRSILNLEKTPEDTLHMAKNLRPCSPPLKHNNFPLGFKPNLANASKGVGSRRKVFKQTAFDAAMDAVFSFAKNFDSDKKKDDDSLLDPKDQDGKSPSTSEASDLSKDDPSLNPDTEIYPYDESAQDKKMAMMDTSFSEVDTTLTDEDGKIIDSQLDTASSTKDDASPNDSLIAVELLEKTDKEFPRDMMNLILPSWSAKDPFIEVNDIEDKPTITRSPSPQTKGLPWSPKVRNADIQNHISSVRQKFFGYILKEDMVTLFGLPEPIVEGIEVMRKHLYVSLADVQLKREDRIFKYPVTHGELIKDYKDAPAERLYAQLLPKMPQYIIALLKILLAASTPTKSKNERSESINIMNEIDQSYDELNMEESIKYMNDVTRYKEIVVKSVSSTLILLLKHFKINHIYQFEYVTQQMMFANCIPLILKFLSQDVYSFVQDPFSKYHDSPDTSQRCQDTCEYSRRNLFTCINMVRILNKLVKWKHSRIMMLVVFKSAQTLIKALNIRNPVFQLYVLKLLKMQLKFMGRPWKKSNMRLISAIYQKVRHRLTDDWAYSNDNEAKPWDFQAEEFSLQSNIHKFHQRRYHHILNNTKPAPGIGFDSNRNRFMASQISDNEFDYVEEDMDKVEIPFSSNFENNYEKWLDNEVFKRRTDWLSLLDTGPPLLMAG